MWSRRRFLHAGAAAIGLLAARPAAWAGIRPSSGEAVVRMRASPDGAAVWFDPVGLWVEPGTRLRFVLEAGVHTTTAHHPDNGRPLRLPRGAAPWDSGYLVEPGAEFSVLLSVEGVYDYFCRPHELAGMAGRILVAARGTARELVASLGADPYPESTPALPEPVRRSLPPPAGILAAGTLRRGG